MRSQFIGRRTRYQRAVAVDISEREAAPVTRCPDNAVEGVGASGPRHKFRCSRCSAAHEVAEHAQIFADYDVKVTCERQKMCDTCAVTADQWTRSECAVAVKIGKRWGAAMRSFPSVVIVTLCGLLNFADVEAVEGVGESGPLHERRRLRRPDVLEVVEPAIRMTKYEVQVACERHKTCGRSLSVGGRGLSVPSPSRSPSAGGVDPLTSMPSKGFALPVLCTNTGALDVPMFSK